MTQDRIVFNSPDLSPQCQEHSSLFNPAEVVTPERVSAKTLSISIEESPSKRLLRAEVKPKVIDRVLARLSVLEFSGKDYVKSCLRRAQPQMARYRVSAAVFAGVGLQR